MGFEKNCCNHCDLRLAKVAKSCIHCDLSLAKVSKRCNHCDLSLAKVAKSCNHCDFSLAKVAKMSRLFLNHLDLLLAKVVLVLFNENSFRFIASKNKKKKIIRSKFEKNSYNHCNL